MKFKQLLFFISFIFSLILPFFLYKLWTFAKWFDALFLVGLLLVVIYCSMLLIEGQFFTAFFKSMRNFFAKVNKKDALIRESEKRSVYSVDYYRKFPKRKDYLHVGLVFCVGGFVVSVAYFFLS